MPPLQQKGTVQIVRAQGSPRTMHWAYSSPARRPGLHSQTGAQTPKPTHRQKLEA